MILVLFLLGIVIVIATLIILVINSTIQLNVKNLEVGNINKENNNYQVEILLKVFDKFTVYKTVVSKEKIQKIYDSKILKKLHIKQDLKNEIKFRKQEFLEILKRVQIEIVKFNLKINIGLEDAAITALVVWGLSSIISIILPFLLKPANLKKCKYCIMPIYMQRNLYNIKLKGIIKLKVVHIIYVIYILVKKGRDENERASNRRTYDYSNGFN